MYVTARSSACEQLALRCQSESAAGRLNIACCMIKGLRVTSLQITSVLSASCPVQLLFLLQIKIVMDFGREGAH
jgi:hypothetical protein